jgi:hypothetical protein
LLDGSDGGHGGQPASSIILKHCSHPGAAQSKSSIRTKTAGEVTTLNIMFSSDSKQESNYAENAPRKLDSSFVIG